MVKTTGAEWNRFYTDQSIWGDGQWHDDVVITVDGAAVEEYEELPIASIVTIDGGIVLMEGDTYGDGNSPSMETYFRRWKKAQTTAVLSVECPKDNLDAVKAAIKSAGGKAVF